MRESMLLTALIRTVCAAAIAVLLGWFRHPVLTRRLIQRRLHGVSNDGKELALSLPCDGPTSLAAYFISSDLLLSAFTVLTRPIEDTR